MVEYIFICMYVCTLCTERLQTGFYFTKCHPCSIGIALFIFQENNIVFVND